MTSDQEQKTWSVKHPLRLGLFTVFVLFGGFFTWAVLAEISGAIITQGRIETDQNHQIIQHVSGGSIEKIYVREGDVVKANDLLLRLKGHSHHRELSILEGQLHEMMARHTRFIAERDDLDQLHFDPQLLKAAITQPEVMELMEGQRNLFSVRKSSLQNQIKQINKRKLQIKTQIQGLNAQKQSLTQQLSLINQELGAQEKLLKRGLSRAGNVLALQRQNAALSGQMGEISANIAQSEVQLSDIELEILRLTTARREEAISQLRDLRYQEFSLNEQREELLENIRNLDIKAPVSGVVYAMEVHNEETIIQAAQPLMYLIAQNRPPRIMTKVEPSNIDEIITGQDVIVRFSSLDSRNPPELQAYITLISADTYDDQATGGAYYRVEVTLRDGEITHLDKDTLLIPGMPVDVYIRTQNRSPLMYLVQPFAEYFNRALRG